MNTIFKFFDFDVFDYKEAEKLLNQMLEKGYLFKGTGKGHIKGVALFEKNEQSKRLKYTIALNMEKKTEALNKFYKFYKSQGWYIIDCFGGKLHIFATENLSQPFPSYTDSLTELECIHKEVKRGRIFNFLGILICLGLDALVIYLGGISLKPFVNEIVLGFFIIMAFFCLDSFISNEFYFIKCKNTLGIGCETPAFKFLQKKKAIIRTFTLLVCIVVLFITAIGCITELQKLKPEEPSFLFLVFLASVLCIPILMVTTYKLFFDPNNQQLRTFSKVGYLLGFASAYIYFTQYVFK